VSQQDTSGSTPAPQDRWGTLTMPSPVKPDPRTVRELAQAGMSKRGLIAISDRKTAKSALAGQVEREESPLARVSTVLAVVERAAPWAVGTAAVVFAVALLLTGSLGRSIVLTAAAAGGQFLWIIREWSRDRWAEFKHRD